MSDPFHWDCDKARGERRIEINVRLVVNGPAALRCGGDAASGALGPHTMRLCGCCIECKPTQQLLLLNDCGTLLDRLVQ
ncbi:unnamed protein product, partial [Iphiclides podalirius]